MKAYFACMAFIAVLVTSCGNGGKQNNTATDQMVSDKKPQTIDGLSNADDDKSVADTTASGNTSSPIIPQNGQAQNMDWDKKIIKTANINLELKDYNSFNNNIHKSLKSYSAYVSAEDQQSTNDKTENKLVIKVPVAQFEDLVNSLAGDGIKVIEKNITSEDVTGEVVDTKSRLEAKKEVRDRYLELLKEAKNMKDILAVQDEINSTQEDIESADGRVAYLQHDAAFSTINLDYYQYLTVAASENIAPTFFNKLKNAFNDGASFTGNFFLFFISIWPLILFSFIVFVYYKHWKSKRASNKVSP
jgi:hypothetical protein